MRPLLIKLALGATILTLTGCATTPPEDTPLPALRWIKVYFGGITLPSGDPAFVTVLRGRDAACSHYAEKKECYRLWAELPTTLPPLTPLETEHFHRFDSGLELTRVHRETLCALTQEELGGIPCPVRWKAFLEALKSRS